MFLPSLVCASEVTADVHQCVSACPSFMFSPGGISLHAALPFFSIRFRSLRFGASNDFVCNSFTYLEFLYLRYLFSYAIFISACFHLRCHSGLSLLVWDFSNHFLLSPLMMWYLSISSLRGGVSFHS